MTYKNAISLTILALSLVNMASGQEVVSGLQVNRDLKFMASGKPQLKSKGLNDTLELPFFDDFSSSFIYPDDSLWADNEVYINNTLALNPMSMGVASFDALASTGLLYENASSVSFEADHLTSKPINLEGGAIDDFYLSFFYQAQGIVDPPEAADSLTLEFYSVSDESWYSVWKMEGSEVHPFKPVIIGINEPKYTHKGFRFRFTNYASLSSTNTDPGIIGNADQWSIDYVYLDRGRNEADTVLRDVSFTSPLRSVLLNYESMPWEQFKLSSLSEMGDSLNAWIVNNDSIERNVSRELVIKDLYEGAIVYSSTPAARNIAPGENYDFGAPVIYTFNSATIDSALFEVSAILTTDIFDKKVNDTIRYLQEFRNYYSRDDGSAEYGYGIASDNSMAVVRFYSPTPDTLRAIQICFNDSYLDSNQDLFDLVVLNSSNQSPGDIIYTQEEERVDPGTGINGFVTYRLDEPLYIDDEFFVGWRQRSSDFLNAGLDMNTPNEGKQFYYEYGSWFASTVGGSLMIRPIVGKELITTGINDTRAESRSVNIWPNPVSDILHIDDIVLYPGDGSRIDIYNSSGSRVWSEDYKESINISGLAEGIYFMVIYRKGSIYSRNKFIRTGY